MRNFCLVILFLLRYTVSIGQDTQVSPKWELGVDVYSLIKPAEPHLPRSTYGLIVKRMVKNDHALRFRTNFGFDYVPDPLVKGANQPRTYNLSFDVGREEQRRYGKFVHYYGIDAQFKYINTNSTIGIGVNGPASTFNQQSGLVLGGGIAPFTGGKFMITNRIAVAIETNVTLHYVKIRGYSQEVDINNNPLTPKDLVSRTSGITFDIVPLSALYVSYYF